MNIWIFILVVYSTLLTVFAIVLFWFIKLVWTTLIDHLDDDHKKGIREKLNALPVSSLFKIKD